MDQMEQLKLIKLGQLTILDKKIGELVIKIERLRNELLLYLSIDIDVERLRVDYIVQAAQELNDTLNEYK